MVATQYVLGATLAPPPPYPHVPLREYDRIRQELETEKGTSRYLLARWAEERRRNAPGTHTVDELVEGFGVMN